MANGEARELKNVAITMDGDDMVVRINMKQNFGRSGGGTGKTNVIATTSGFAPIPGFKDTWLSLNCNTKEGVAAK